MQTDTDLYLCSKSKKWIKIIGKIVEDIPFHTSVIRCSKCKSYAFLNFVHDELGDYYGPDVHANCEGNYVYLCTKQNTHIIEPEDDD